MKQLFKYATRLKGYRNLWLGLYSVKAILALAVAVPVFLSSNSVLSSSQLSRQLINSWDISVLVQLVLQKGDAIGLFIAMIISIIILYLLIMQFVNGGLYFIIVSGRKLSEAGKDFFAECGARFLGHLKVTLLIILVYMMLLFSGMFIVNMFGVFGRDLIGFPALVFMFGKLIIIFLILMAASIFSDSARAAIAVEPEKPFKEILKLAGDFFRPRFTRLIGIYIITYLPFIVIWLLIEYLALMTIGSIGGLIGIFLEFLFFQIVSMARTGQKLWYLFYLGGEFRNFHEGRFVPRQSELNLE